MDAPVTSDFMCWHSVESGLKSESNTSMYESECRSDCQDILSTNQYRSLVVDDMSDFNDELVNNVHMSVRQAPSSNRSIQKNTKKPHVVINKYPGIQA